MERLAIIGNLTKDPEMRTTQSGVNVCTFTVAVNKPLTKAQREAGQQPQAKFFRVSAWRELGESCSRYLAKGKKVHVAGSVDVNVYTGNDGQPHGSLELTAHEVEFLSPRGEGGNDSGSTAATAPAPAPAPAPQQMGFTEANDEELPF